jgi:protein-tyrosine phosphatase
MLQSNNALAEPVKIPGMEYLEININGKGFERSLLWQLKIWSFIKLIFLMAIGYRMAAISILGREVMLPRGLVGLGLDSIDHCGPEIRDALEAFSAASRYPILVHCTQGKDRTGLLIALLLFLMDIPIDAITYDYTLSEAELLPERESRMKEIREIGLSEEFAGTPKDWIPKMKEHLDDKYGGIKKYLSSIGVDGEMQERIVEVLSL